jgi:hypothetical protein
MQNMPVDWTISFSTAIGGVVSGLVGIGYSEYRTRRERKQREKEWFSQVSRISDEVKQSVDAYESESSVSQLAALCRDVTPKIRERALNPPTSADEELLELLREFRILADEVADIQPTVSQSGEEIVPPQQREAVQSLSDAAESIKPMADDGLRDVGWI